MDDSVPEDEYHCTLCRLVIRKTQESLSQAWVLTEKGGPTCATNCSIQSFRYENAQLIHKSCYLAAVQVAKNGRLRSSFRWLHDNNRFLWAVPRATLEGDLRTLAADAFEEKLQVLMGLSWDLSGIFFRIAGLPPELRAQIAAFAYPSALAGMCILLRNVKGMMEKGRSYRKRGYLSDSRSIQGVTKGKYIQDIEETASEPTQPLVVGYDDFGCVSAKYNNCDAGEPIKTASWYQIIPPRQHKKLIVCYKGDLVGHITSRKFFRKIYMRDAPVSAKLFPRHCFGLPLTDLSLRHAIQNPVRLRRSEITARKRTVTVACTGNSVVDLQIHEQDSTDLDIYHRVEGQSNCRSMTTWLSATLDDKETIREIVVRAFWNLDRSQIFESTLLLITSFARKLSFAPYLLPSSRQHYEYLRLVNDPYLCVSDLFLNERSKDKDRMRLGVVCSMSPSPMASDANMDWVEIDPVSSPPTTNLRDAYVAQLDITAFDAFEACIDDDAGGEARATLKPCLGLRFAGNILGQWRYDRPVVACTRPSSYGLYNGMNGSFPAVYLVDGCTSRPHMVEGGQGFVSMDGTLEWWTSPRGSQVARVY